MIWLTNGVVLALGMGGALLMWLPGWHLAALIWMGALFAGVATYHSHFAQTLQNWLHAPDGNPVPAGHGVWADILDRIAQQVRGAQTATSELTSEIDDIRAAVDRLPDAMIVLDNEHVVRWCNRAAVQLHGIFETNRPIQQFIRQPEFSRYLNDKNPERPLRTSLSSRPGRTFELRLHETGEDKLLLSRDITEQAKLDDLRNDFVANVSHEIRTPVTVIGGFAETMLDLELKPAQQREYLENILKHSQTMQSLVEDLLVLSSLEVSIDETAEDAIDIAKTFQALAADARDVSKGRHIIDIEPPADLILQGSQSEIESAVRNLLTNAVRYTPEGGTISLSWSLHDTDGWISVQDNGIGIAPEHLPRLSERFYRVDRGRSRSTGGTGLGLAIVKRIANRHNATLHIDSKPGAGSTFSLIFPASQFHRATEPAATS